MLAKAGDIGRARRIESVRARYVEFIKRTLPREVSFEGLRVVIDCAHGAAYKVAPETLWELGAEVISIGAEPDGFNINREVGSTAPRALINKVLEMRADIGIALDGDADRVLIVDEKGQLIDGDQLLALIAERLAAEGRLSQPGLVATVMSNGGLDRHLASQNLSLARTAVGDRYVIERMRKDGYNLGGEQSGHIILSDHGTTGDGLVAALQVLAAIRQAGKPTSEVCRRFEPLPQVLESIAVARDHCPSQADIDRITDDAVARLGKLGRMLVRRSGTENVIRVMAEGEDLDVVTSVVGSVREELRQGAERKAMAA